MQTKCIVCRRCLCSRCHPADPCEAIDRGRRIFLLGALALPVAPRLVLPEPAPVVSYAGMTLSIDGAPAVSWQSIHHYLSAIVDVVGAVAAEFSWMEDSAGLLVPVNVDVKSPVVEAAR